MGTLPTPRVNISHAFTHTGVDFSGPIELRSTNGRGRRVLTKGYIAIFICLCTKAIHLEAVSNLSTKAFLAALRRFIGRRGTPTSISSDNGTNFIGCSRKLKDIHHNFKAEMSTEIVSSLADQGIEWNFIPPASPHFGGLWEAGVKSMKFHLKRIVGDRSLTFEELTTVLCQIEACLNSRPLCPITNDPTNLRILTPGHFQMGAAPLTPPEAELSESNVHSLTRWKLLQKIYQDFWKRWSSEYLSRLQQRPKWTRKERNVKEGDLIIIKDERLPACKWLLGRIISTHPGKDGLVRVVTVKTANSTIQRPITKICVLPESETANKST